MNEADIVRLIRTVLRQELAPILMATLQSNESNQRSTIQRSSSEGPIPNLRNIQPFGLSSRAPTGTEVLTTPISFDPTHIVMTGHFDKTKPTCADGETLLYDAYGHVVYLSEGKMQFGSKASANPMMLGDLVQQLLSQFLDKVANHTHAGPGYPPTTAAEFVALKESPVDDGSLVSDKTFTEK